MNIKDRMIEIFADFLDKEYPICPDFDKSKEECDLSECKDCWIKWAKEKASKV
jgi:hypothetical protein